MYEIFDFIFLKTYFIWTGSFLYNYGQLSVIINSLMIGGKSDSMQIFHVLDDTFARSSVFRRVGLFKRRYYHSDLFRSFRLCVPAVIATINPAASTMFDIRPDLRSSSGFPSSARLRNFGRFRANNETFPINVHRLALFRSFASPSRYTVATRARAVQVLWILFHRCVEFDFLCIYARNISISYLYCISHDVFFYQLRVSAAQKKLLFCWQQVVQVVIVSITMYSITTVTSQRVSNAAISRSWQQLSIS